ncbi:MAG: OmpH family outer membrane protein [Elusimicrobia bacterium]|nr:OmpH family outer membrane protein [Elusimicrobiota bacterium]
MRKLLALGLFVLAAGTARALEVSLEENKAQRGNIGYVDMQKLFRLYPETQKAKQNFEEVLRQAEDQVNLRKAELIGLRAEIIRLRMERDAAAKLAAGIPATPTPAPKPPEPVAPPAPEPATSTMTVVASTDTIVSSTDTVASSTDTVIAVDTATAVLTNLLSGTTTAATPEPTPEDKGAPLIINLPGLSPEPYVVQPPKAALEAAASLPDLEAKLAERSKLLQDKEAEFKTYQTQVEKNLLELEDKKTEILLGKIYRAVQEVAREEGVSVVVDRTQILFGHQAMDLTDKVIKKLKS